MESKKNLELRVLTVINSLSQATIDDIKEELEDISLETIQKVIDDLLEYEFIEKYSENGNIYYKVLSDYQNDISRIRITRGAGDTISADLPPDIDMVPNQPFPDLVERDSPAQAPAFTQSEMPSEAAYGPDQSVSEEEYFPRSQFEYNLGNAFQSDVPWKKELIEIVKLIDLKGDRRSTIELFENAIKKAKNQGTYEQLTELYYNMATQWDYLNKKDEVRNCYLKVLDIARESDNPKKIIIALKNLGAKSHRYKNYEDALREYQEALSSAKDNNLQSLIHDLLPRIASVYKDLNQFENALEYYLKDLELSRKSFKNSLPSLYNKIGGVLIKLGRERESIEYFDNAFKLYKKRKDNRNQIISLMNKNVALYNLKMWDELVDLYLQVVELTEDEEKKEGLWQQLGSFIHFTTKKDVIKKYKDKITKMKEKGEPEEVAGRMRAMTKRMVIDQVSGASKFAKALWNYNIAVAEFVDGKIKSASSFYKRAEELYQELEDLKGIGQCNHHLGLIAIKKGKYKEAIERLTSAAEAYENMKKEVSVEEFRTTLQSDVVPVLEDLSYAYLLNNDHRNALNTLERGKNREIIRNMEGFDTTSVCPELKDLISEERKLLDEFHYREQRISDCKNSYMYNEVPYEEYIRDIRELNKEIKEYTKKLRTIRTKIYEKCADPGAVQPSLDYNIVEEYVNSLNDEEILTVELFYYERESKIFVFLINTKGKIEIFDKDINNTALKDSVRKLKTGIDTLNSNIIDKLSVELFNLIFPEDFCKKYLNKPSDIPVMIIPHRELFSIPWEILKNPKSKGNFGGYMGLELQLIRNFSLDLARIMIKKSKKERGNLLLLFGNPTEDLDGAKKEVLELKESIRDKMPVKLFLEKEIIRDVFKKNMGMNDVGVIHYAGHADFLESEPSLSLLLLSDGALTARELGLVKTNNPLFFISACESGQAKGTGGGEVFGIIRGLTLSGSQTIVSTNWQVSDASQKDLAIKFYEKLNDGMTAVSALRDARRYNRIKYKDILDWASTTVYGNPLYYLK